MRRERQAKIVATLGPASSGEEEIARLFEAGADAFRLNFSHGSHDEHAERYRIIRWLEERYGRPIGIIADLQGPKLRVGSFAGGEVRLQAGQPFRLDMDSAPGTTQRAPLPHPEIFAALTPGTQLLLDDGKIQLEITASGPDFADARVITGGILSDHKGVNVPGAVLEVSALTAKDRSDLAFALDLGVGWVALSFVQRREDVDEAKELIGGRAGLIAKLEKPSAIEHLLAIVDRADAVMVARGDLGVEMPAEDVPVLQKRIVRACRAAGRPVVVATQMLDSMVNAPRPTRAEASDVATAVYEGADAVMLSAETAVGSYPVEAVAMMERIIRRVERDPAHRTGLDVFRVIPEATASDAITSAARQVAETVDAVAIVTFTASGSTTLRAARERPLLPILGLTHEPVTADRLTLAWGVHALSVRHFTSEEAMIEEAVRRASSEGFAVKGDRLVVSAGLPLERRGLTNALRIVDVEEAQASPIPAP